MLIRRSSIFINMECNTPVADVTLSIEVLAPSGTFFKKFMSVSHFHRKLTNGWNRVGRVSNRDWWKSNVQLGYYTYRIANGWLSITYHLHLNTNTDKERVYKNLRYRVKNQILSTINVLEPIPSQKLIETYKERTTYQSFGHLFKSSNYEYQLQTR